jgi:hypothetical protein
MINPSAEPPALGPDGAAARRPATPSGSGSAIPTPTETDWRTGHDAAPAANFSAAEYVVMDSTSAGRAERGVDGVSRSGQRTQEGLPGHVEGGENLDEER